MQGLMSVDKYISELLYDHDCVIVPQLGGFVANYASAKIHPTQHTFTPPAKNIVFNKNLINNDGLLANHIVNSEHTDYPKAINTINHFVNTTHAQLKKGVKVKMDNIGTLYLDPERNIQFEPGATNFLLDAFGLSQFQSPAIKRDNSSKRIEFKDRQALPLERKRSNIKRYVALAVALPIIFGMVWIPLKTNLLKGIIYSTLNPFASKEAAKYKTREAESIKALEVKDFEAASLLNENDTSRYITFNLKENSTQSITAKMIDMAAAETVKPDTTKVAVGSTTNETDFKFHLVTGCFQIQDNAINFVKTLQQQNINAAIIGRNKAGLYVVSCGNYITYKEASNQLGQLRKVKPDAWLYKN